MDPEQLWETTMVLKTAPPAGHHTGCHAGGCVFSGLMGDNVQPTEFIEANAKYVTNLDIARWVEWEKLTCLIG